MDQPRIFISHTHTDEALAKAWAALLTDLFGEAYLLRYSTSREPDSGLAPGENWVRWIAKEVRQASVALVLLTPTSIRKPWVLWEAGALEGVAIAAAVDDETRAIRPVVYGVLEREIPDPFRRLQILKGDSESDLTLLCRDLLKQHPSLSGNRMFEIGQKLGPKIAQHLKDVGQLMLTLPQLPTEPAVAEWRSRLDQLALARRTSEVRHVHRWMDIAFGQDQSDPMPLDIGLHRKLGELYVAARDYERAIVQFDLARRLSPRDIYLLRALGEAYLELERYDDARSVIVRIEQLDGDAFIHSVECAALRGRWKRQTGDIEGAALTYQEALDRNPDSYYLADVLAQIRLEQDDIEAARAVYSRALAIIERLGENNVWAHATAAAGAIVTGREQAATIHLASIKQLRPDADQVAAIGRGLKTVQVALALPDSALSGWLREVSGESESPPTPNRV